MSIKTRRAHTFDLDAVTALFDAYRCFYGAASDVFMARAFMEERLRLLDSVVLLALDHNGTAAGFTQLYPSFSSIGCIRVFLLNDLFVSPCARSRGVGRALLSAARALALEAGAKRLVLETAVDNRVAQALYESAGFERDAGFFTYTLHLD